MIQKTNQLIIAILIAAVLISGSLIFLGTKLGLSKDDIKSSVIAGLDEFVNGGGNEVETIPVEGDYSDDDAVLGNADAPVTMIEFSDFQCPACVSFFNTSYQGIKQNYVASGKVKIISRDFPLTDKHPGAYPAALATECVREQGGDDMFFKMYDKLFGNSSTFNGDLETIKKNIADFAKELGVDMSKYTACVNSDKFKDEIFADQADGQKAGVEGTPAFIINGQLLIGAYPYEAFAQIIDKALAE